MAAVVVDPVSGREVILTDAFAANAFFNVKATGYAGTAAAGVTTNLDFAVGAEDRYINGLHLFLKGHAWGDRMTLQVVDVDGVLVPAGTVLNEFATNWNANDERQDQGANVFDYVARLPAGIYIRIVYVSIGGADVDVRCNFLLHKKIS